MLLTKCYIVGRGISESERSVYLFITPKLQCCVNQENFICFVSIVFCLGFLNEVIYLMARRILAAIIGMLRDSKNPAYLYYTYTM